METNKGNNSISAEALTFLFDEMERRRKSGGQVIAVATTPEQGFWINDHGLRGDSATLAPES